MATGRPTRESGTSPRSAGSSSRRTGSCATIPRTPIPRWWREQIGGERDPDPGTAPPPATGAPTAGAPVAPAVGAPEDARPAARVPAPPAFHAIPANPTSSGRIFISYRREETAGYAGWLHERLAIHFGKGRVVKDVTDVIQLGQDFVEVVTDTVRSCDVLLALIGDRWLTITDATGRRRLDDPGDVVRQEIGTALALDHVRVVPILLEHAPMPTADQLPASLVKLTRRQALQLSLSRFESDIGRLLMVLDRVVGAGSSSAQMSVEGATTSAPVVGPSSLETPASGQLSGRTTPISESRGPSRGPDAGQVKLFISYSHRDERYLKGLETHLASLRRQGVVADWHDRMISPGEKWRQKINDNLDLADCVLLLVTPDFIASDYCYSVEMEQALDKHREGRILILPIIVRPVDWQHTPLGELQVLPKDGKPIVEWSIRDRAWLDVTRGLRLALDRFTQG